MTDVPLDIGVSIKIEISRDLDISRDFDVFNLFAYCISVIKVTDLNIRAILFQIPRLNDIFDQWYPVTIIITVDQ